MTTPHDLDFAGSLPDLHAAFAEASEPTLDALIGAHDGAPAGPLWMRATGSLIMRFTGMPGWCGKEFQSPEPGAEVLRGHNRVRRHGRVEPSIPMTARVAPSRVDGRLAIVVSYPTDAQYPWRHVNDELRPIDDGTLLGLTWGIPGGPRGGAPFSLRRVS